MRSGAERRKCCPQRGQTFKLSASSLTCRWAPQAVAPQRTHMPVDRPRQAAVAGVATAPDPPGPPGTAFGGTGTAGGVTNDPGGAGPRVAPGAGCNAGLRCASGREISTSGDSKSGSATAYRPLPKERLRRLEPRGDDAVDAAARLRPVAGKVQAVQGRAVAR